jgi:hypothetical protein
MDWTMTEGYGIPSGSSFAMVLRRRYPSCPLPYP